VNDQICVLASGRIHEESGDAGMKFFVYAVESPQVSVSQSLKGNSISQPAHAVTIFLAQLVYSSASHTFFAIVKIRGSPEKAESLSKQFVGTLQTALHSLVG
jgi:hypothetical protein